jgi:hypothetical protein
MNMRGSTLIIEALAEAEATLDELLTDACASNSGAAMSTNKCKILEKILYDNYTVNPNRKENKKTP